MSAMTLTEFLLARITEDEAAAQDCAEMFPPPWEIADRGWRVRIYSNEVPEVGDHAEPGWTRAPVVMEVEPDRHIKDPKWLSERVAHIVRWDTARVQAECEALRSVISRHRMIWDTCDVCIGTLGEPPDVWCETLADLATVYADHPDYQHEWKP